MCYEINAYTASELRKNFCCGQNLPKNSMTNKCIYKVTKYMWCTSFVMCWTDRSTDLFENTQTLLCCEKKKIYKDVTHESDMWLEKCALIVTFSKYLQFVTSRTSTVLQESLADNHIERWRMCRSYQTCCCVIGNFEICIICMQCMLLSTF